MLDQESFSFCRQNPLSLELGHLQANRIHPYVAQILTTILHLLREPGYFPSQMKISLLPPFLQEYPAVFQLNQTADWPSFVQHQQIPHFVQSKQLSL